MTRFRIEGPVGPAHSVDGADVKTVKRALSALRLTKGPADVTGIPNREMFDGIRRFQRNNRLRVDGEMAPAGPTARLMSAALIEQSAGAGDKAGPSPLSAAVGRDAPNRPKDTAVVRQTLIDGGYLSDSRASSRPEQDLEFGIRSLQRDFNLTQDGRIEPGGETERLALRLKGAAATDPKEAQSEEEEQPAKRDRPNESRRKPPSDEQIEDARRHLADMSAKLEDAKRRLAAKEQAMAEAIARRDAALDRVLANQERLARKAFRRGRDPMNQVEGLWTGGVNTRHLVAEAQLELLEDEQRGDKRAESDIALFTSLKEKAERRLADLLRRRAESESSRSRRPDSAEE